MKKQVIFIICVVITIIAVIIGVGSIREKDIEGISRYEWIQMLVEKFGANEVADKNPYFEDVNSDNEYFSCVQSAYEWGIIDNDSLFSGEEACDGEFVAITAMKAVGKYKVQIYLEKEDEPTDKDYIELAIREKLIEKKQLEEGISLEESKKILLQAFELYQHGLWKEDVCNIEYQDGIIEIAKEDIIALNEDYSEIELSDKYTGSIEEGCNIIIEDSETGEKIAKKVIQSLDGKTYALTDTEIEEVIESVMISDVMAVSKDNVVSYYELADRRVECKPINAVTNYNYMPVYFDDWKGENFSVEIPVGEDGVTVQISDLYIGTQILGSLSKGIEYANVQTEADITVSGGFSLEKEETFPIFKTAIVLAGGTARVDIEFYLILSLDGSVKIEVKIPTQFSVDYKKGTGIRSPKVDFTPEKPEFIADCNAGCYMRTEVVPSLLGIAILDTEADIGVTVSASVTERLSGDVWQCADFAISYPLITINVSGDDDKKTLLGKLNLSAEWEILNRDNTFVNEDMHCEWHKDGTYKIVDECTYQLTGNYKATFESVFLDKGNYYQVIGTLYLKDYIPCEVADNMAVGETYDFYGTEYTFMGEEKLDKIFYDYMGEECPNDIYEYSDLVYKFVDENNEIYYAYLSKTQWSDYTQSNVYYIKGIDGEREEDGWGVGSRDVYTMIERNIEFKVPKETPANIITSISEQGATLFNYQSFTVQECYESEIKDFRNNIFTNEMPEFMDIQLGDNFTIQYLQTDPVKHDEVYEPIIHEM